MSKIITNQSINIKEKKSESIIIIASYIFICIIVIFLYYQIYLASSNKKSFTKYLYNIITIVVPIILIFILLTFTSFEKNFATLVIFGSLFCCTLIFIVYYFLKTNISTYIFNNYLLNTIIILLFLVGLSIIFTIFSGTLRKLNGWTGFFVNILFYIPCLIRDFVKELISEYNTSSTTVLILFIFEILLIIMYFLVIPIINKYSLPEKIVILSDPVMLNTEITMPNIIKDKSNSNFAVSMWIYLNSMPNTKQSYTKETVIYNYYNKNPLFVNNPHIKISYLNSDKGSNDFIMQIGKTKFNISLPLQKWNNFVINYVTSKSQISTNKLKTKTYSDGIYKGEIKINNDGTFIKEGYGKYTYKMGNIYEGQWLNDEKSGLGTFTTYSNKIVEDGIWEENQQIYRFIYDDNIKTDKFSGKGKIIKIENGDIYSGYFKDGVKHGYGTLTNSSGTIINKGYWINDVFKSENIIDINSEISTKYVGSKTYNVDIFINGALERSYTFNNHETPVFMDSDVMVIGETMANDGLYGSICNIEYYQKPLSQLAIIYNYNLLTVINPPI